MTTKLHLPGVTARRTIAIMLLAVLITAAISFTAGWRLSPDQISRGYSMGNQDGYSTGYNDGRQGAEPDLYRFMTPDDHTLRSRIGGRAFGEHPR